MAKVFGSEWEFKDSSFGPLLPYIEDDQITDINFNGTDVWVEHLTKGIYKTDVQLTQEFVNQFSTTSWKQKRTSCEFPSSITVLRIPAIPSPSVRRRRLCGSMTRKC